MSLTPSPSCGREPTARRRLNANQYVDCFEKAHGEQALFISVSARAVVMFVKMPADGAAREIGVAQCMDERAGLLDRDRAPSEGGNRQGG
jgi:hypothetical protein